MAWSRDDMARHAAAEKIILEERLTGREVSLLMFVDGENCALMPPVGMNSSATISRKPAAIRIRARLRFESMRALSCEPLAASREGR